MTIISCSTAVRRGGGGFQSTLLAPPKKMVNKGHGSPGGGAGEVVDARNQEKAENYERQVPVHAPCGLRQEPDVAVVALPLPPPTVQGPAKRGRDASAEVIWPAKKYRSAVAGTHERGNVIVEANRGAAAATPFPRIQEPAKLGTRGNGEKNRPFKDTSNRDDVVYTAPSLKKGHCSPGGSAGEAVDEKKEEKVEPCAFAVAVDDPHDLHKVSEVAVLALTVPTRNDQEAATGGYDANGEEACWLIKKHCRTAAAVCKGGNVAVDQVNREVHSMLSPRIKEAVKYRTRKNGKNKDRPLKDIPVPSAVAGRNGGIHPYAKKELDLHVVYKKQAPAVCQEFHNLPTPEAKTAQGDVTNQSDCKTKKQPSKSMSTVGSEDSCISGLSARLQSLGVSVTNVTSILAKDVSGSDCSFTQLRLLLSSSTVRDSPLLSMLTPDERGLMYSKDDGLPAEALDRHGCSYDMTLKYLKSNNGYRLIGHWGKFLTQNGLCKGDLLELGAFRFEGQLVLTLLHYGVDFQGDRGKQGVDFQGDRGKQGGVDFQGDRRMQGVEFLEGRTCLETEESKEWSSREIEAVQALLMLADFEDDTESQ